MATFIKTTICDGPLVWKERLINMDNVVSIEEHDATEQFNKRPVKEPFASQPLFCQLLICIDGVFERVWVHDSMHNLIVKVGQAQHADNFKPPVDIASLGKEWLQKRNKFSFAG